MAIDLLPVPGLVCGQTYHSAVTEAQLPTLRADEPSAYPGCGKPMAWIHTYRCLTCGRWLHNDCIRRHFKESGDDNVT